jgi:hypothetical protein
MSNINKILNLQKSTPIFSLVYNEQLNLWEPLTTSKNSNFNSFDFKGALNPQKSVLGFLFIYDEVIKSWKPIKKTNSIPIPVPLPLGIGRMIIGVNFIIS